MKTERIFLNDFREDTSHFSRISLLVTVKSFDLQAIRKRYVASRKRSKAGSVERRKPSQGGVVALTIADGKITDLDILARITEARGVDIFNEKCVLSSEDKIFLFKSEAGTPEIIEHPWFSYIHTVKFHREKPKMLISSSGLDYLCEYDLVSKNVIWEWLAWENGINRGEDPKTGESYFLTRRSEEAEALEKDGEKVMLISNPKEQQLPTALRAAFINSTEYNRNGNVLATQFHAGRVIEIDRDTGTFEKKIDGLTRPHGGMEYAGGLLATDTAGGAVVRQDEISTVRYDFTTMPGKAEGTENMEWLQTSHFVDNTIITIDSNRTSFILFDPEAEKRAVVPFPADWAVQDFVLLQGNQEALYTKIKNYFR